jgi:hypothetical protein
MATGMNHHHFPANQPADPEEPTPTDLALIAAQLVRTGGKTLQQGDDRYAKAAETAHKLWSACNAYLNSTRKVELDPTEKIREIRRKELRALGVREPAGYPVELRQFLILARCPGRSHPDRLAKFRAWRRSLGGSDDLSQCEPIENFWRFADYVLGFWKWLKSERSKSSKRDHTSKKIE